MQIQLEKHFEAKCIYLFWSAMPAPRQRRPVRSHMMRTSETATAPTSHAHKAHPRHPRAVRQKKPAAFVQWQNVLFVEPSPIVVQINSDWANGSLAARPPQQIFTLLICFHKMYPLNIH